MNHIERRVWTCRLIELINDNKEMAEKLGIRDVSTFDFSKKERKKGGMNYGQTDSK